MNAMGDYDCVSDSLIYPLPPLPPRRSQPPKQSKAISRFLATNPKPDLIVESKDGSGFRVHREVLRIHTEWFEGEIARIPVSLGVELWGEGKGKGKFPVITLHGVSTATLLRFLIDVYTLDYPLFLSHSRGAPIQGLELPVGFRYELGEKDRAHKDLVEGLVEVAGGREGIRRWVYGS